MCPLNTLIVRTIFFIKPAKLLTLCDISDKIHVQFEVDGFEYMCPPNRILNKVNKSVYLVKWTDGKNYRARVIAGAENILPGELWFFGTYCFYCRWYSRHPFFGFLWGCKISESQLIVWSYPCELYFLGKNLK